MAATAKFDLFLASPAVAITEEKEIQKAKQEG
jgi:hypothetical protein